jgi:peptide/nickel transport system substrate-binding protein
VRVRRAIANAIDRQALVDVSNAGLGIVTDSNTHPSVPEYNAEMGTIPFDPDAARDLLTEAGWVDNDGDGVREAQGVEGLEDGTPFSVELGTIPFPPYSDSAQVIQQFLADVGIEITINPVDFNIYFSEYLTADSDYQFAMSGWFNFVVPVHTEFVGGIHSEGGNTPWIHWGNEEADALIEEAAKTFDNQERYAIYHRVQEIAQEEVPYVYLFRPDNLIAYNGNLMVPEVGSLTALFNSIPLWEWASS